MAKKSFQEAVDKTKEIIRRFEKIEGKPWGAEGVMLELGKQIGDLSTLLLVKEGYYPPNRGDEDPKYQVSKEKIADELADLLFVVIRLAEFYGIDLEDAHYKALAGADRYLRSKGK